MKSRRTRRRQPRSLPRQASPVENGLLADVGIGALVWFVGIPVAVLTFLVVDGYLHPGDVA